MSLLTWPVLSASSIMIAENVAPLGYDGTIQTINDAAVAQGLRVPAVHTMATPASVTVMCLAGATL